ncbi:hypothetical protein LEP1GSC060_2310 [Leptospira weilii serovar Ranarum str. ICFT]|uniref:Uncharacterized protein n=1 Tax=Leptospira weilii serovar Ranarum str. ICFT TaxID=1218598 RepID=N1WQ70_9LEPT|nr:hypothetical protein LEP1GSC060_2310 [Leptospira weilii serovar Ranarum str. ICFT]
MSISQVNIYDSKVQPVLRPALSLEWLVTLVCIPSLFYLTKKRED